MTGRYQTRFGHEFNPGARRAPGLPLTETTIADRLKAAGYATGLVGKWHLGSRGQVPSAQPRLRRVLRLPRRLARLFPGKDQGILRGTQQVDEKEYLTDAFGREAVAFIDKHKDEPFFLYLAFNAVHTPMQADDPRLKKFAHIADKQRQTYAAMMSAMDDAIGARPRKARRSRPRRKHARLLHQRQRRPDDARHHRQRLDQQAAARLASAPRSKAASACRSWSRWPATLEAGRL